MLTLCDIRIIHETLFIFFPPSLLGSLRDSSRFPGLLHLYLPLCTLQRRQGAVESDADAAKPSTLQKKVELHSNRFDRVGKLYGTGYAVIALIEV